MALKVALMRYSISIVPLALFEIMMFFVFLDLMLNQNSLKSHEDLFIHVETPLHLIHSKIEVSFYLFASNAPRVRQKLDWVHKYHPIVRHIARSSSHSCLLVGA